MKTLEEIKDEYAREFGYKSNLVFNAYEQLIINPHGLTYKVLNDSVNEVAKRYAKEVAREALRNASENAKAVRIAKDGSWSSISPMIRTAKALHYVDKQSILNESNIPKL